MKHSGYCAAAALLMTAVIVSGCGTLDSIVGVDDWEDWVPASTALQISEDGSVTETIIDKLDESWYEGNELQDMIARSMNEYNESHGDGAVNVTAYSDAGGNVSVTIVYRTADDYAGFNNVVFFNGTMLDAQMDGYAFDGTFSSVSGTDISQTGLDSSEPLKHKEYNACISDGTHVVQVPGEIRYISTGAQVVNSHTASDGQSSDAEGNSFFYVIYEM